ncbi:MAG: oligosaccharide flippase family protein [Methylocystis silviterrae]|uniref:lipopolysaccharide biosynthesis protein n=1 Tax=Methylocystis silviterrae TaxID=2743612 RepID=UPI003C7320F2
MTRRPGSYSALANLARANVVVAAVTFISGVLVARALGPERRGELATLVLWPSLVSHLALMGIHISLAREAAREPGRAAACYQIGFRALSLSSIGAILVYCVAVGMLYWEKGSGQKPSLALLAVLMVPFSVWAAFQMQMELGRQNTSNFVLVRNSFAVLHLIFIAAAWLVGCSEVWIFLIASIAAAFLATSIAQFRIAKGLENHDGQRAARVDAGRLLGVFSAAWPYALSGAVSTLTASADRMLVSLFFEPRVMGLYVVTLAISQMQDLMGEAISQLFFSKVALGRRLHDIDKIWLALRLRQTMCVYLLLSCGTLLVAPVLLRLVFGERFSGSVDIVYMLIPILALKGAMRPFEEVLKGGGKPLAQARINAIATASFAISGGLAAWFGSLPVMLAAMFVCTLAGLAMIASAVAYETGLGLRQIVVPRPSDLAGMARQLLAAQRGGP